MSATTILDEAFTALIALSLSVVAACRLTGRSRASHYRRVNPPRARAAPVPQAERAKPPSTLSVAGAGERAGGDQLRAVRGLVDLSGLGP